MKQATGLLAGIFLSLHVCAQFTVSGKISDDSGQALAGANVIIENSYTGTVADSRGDYLLKLSSGEKTFRVSYIGYDTETKEIDVNGTLKVDFTLKRSLIMSEEVIIKGIRAGEKDPVAFTTLKKEDIDERNLGQDIPFLLSLTPSIVATSDAGTGVGYSSFRIRGTDANRINITVNGIPLNDAESHGVWFVNMPDFAGSVENIQVQRGVGTSTNGSSAFGASINFQTLNINRDPYGEVSNSLGSFNTMKNSVSFGTGLLNKRFTLDARLSGIHSDGYIDRASSDLSSWFVSGAWYKEKSLIKLNMFSGQEKTYQAWDGVPSYLLDSLRTYNGMGQYNDENGRLFYYNNETDNYRQNHYQLHYSQKLNNIMNFTGALHLTRGEGYYEQYKEDQSLNNYRIPDIILNADTITTSDLIRRKWLDNYFYGAVFSINIKKSPVESIIGGGWNKYDGSHFGTVIWARHAGNSEIDHKWYESSGLKTDYNAFSKISYSVSKSLSLFTDLQIRGIKYSIVGTDDDQRDITQDHIFFFFNPKMGINYRLNDNQRYFFSFSIANREPNRDNFVDASPYLPTPKHETLHDYELGYDFHSNSVQAGLNFYYMDYKRQLVLTGEINDVGAPVMTNVADSYRAGIEILLGSRISGMFSWDFNINISTNKIKKFSAYIDNWDYWDDPENMDMQHRHDLGETEIAFSPKIIAGNRFKVNPLKGLNFEILSKYVSKQFIDNTGSDNRKLDPWFVNDLRMDYVIHSEKLKQISFNVLIANILNEQYESNAWVYRYIYQGSENKLDGYFPQAGINFLAGMKLRF